MEEVNRMAAEMEGILEELESNLLQAKDPLQTQVDKHWRDVQYHKGDWFYLKMQPFKLKSLTKRVNKI